MYKWRPSGSRCLLSAVALLEEPTGIYKFPGQHSTEIRNDSTFIMRLCLLFGLRFVIFVRKGGLTPKHVSRNLRGASLRVSSSSWPRDQMLGTPRSCKSEPPAPSGCSGSASPCRVRNRQSNKYRDRVLLLAGIDGRERSSCRQWSNRRRARRPPQERLSIRRRTSGSRRRAPVSSWSPRP